MDLKSLVEKALSESPRFKEKYEWRVITRNRSPELNWLIPLLEDALGREFMENAAKLHIAAQEKANSNGKEKDH